MTTVFVSDTEMGEHVTLAGPCPGCRRVLNLKLIQIIGGAAEMKLQLALESRSALQFYGWSKSRRVDVSQARERLMAAGYEVDDYMEEVLSSFSGLTLKPVMEEGVDFRNDEPFIVDPIGAGVRQIKEAKDLRDWFGVPFFRLGGGSVDHMFTSL